MNDRTVLSTDGLKQDVIHEIDIAQRRHKMVMFLLHPRMLFITLGVGIVLGILCYVATGLELTISAAVMVTLLATLPLDFYLENYSFKLQKRIIELHSSNEV